MNGRKWFQNKYLMSVLVAVVVAPVVAISASFAQPGGHRGGRGFGPGPGMGPFEGLRMLRQLDLSDEQRQQVRDVLEKARASGVQKR